MLDSQNKQLERLRRQWQLLEVIKAYRIQIPTVFAALILGVTAFVLTNKELLKSLTSIVFATVVMTVFGVLGLLAQREVQRQYRYSISKIDHLYEKLGMVGAEFEPPRDDTLEFARILFVMGYIIVASTASFAIGAIWMLSDQC